MFPKTMLKKTNDAQNGPESPQSIPNSESAVKHGSDTTPSNLNLFVDENGKKLSRRGQKKAIKRIQAEALQKARADQAFATREAVGAAFGKRPKKQSVDARLKAESKSSKKNMLKKLRARNTAKTVQAAIGYNKMFEDGICEVEVGVYSRTIRFSDITYQTAKLDDQKMIFNRYCELLNYLNDSIHLQLNLINDPVDRESYNKSIALAAEGLEGKPLEYLAEYNKMLSEKSAESTHVIDQQRYFTVTVNAPTYKKAVPLLASVTDDLIEQLHRMGCVAERLDGKERLALLATQLIPDDAFDIDFEDMFFNSLTTKDYIAPASMDFRPQGSSKRFMVGDKHAQVLFVKQFPSDLNDRMLADLADLPVPMNITLHITALDQADAIDLVRKKLSFMNQQRASEAKDAVKQGLDPSFISLELQHSMSEATDLLDNLRNKNQRLFLTSLLVYICADSIDELEESAFQVMSEARKSSVKLATFSLRQRQGLNSCLPLGIDHSGILRTGTTAATAIFIPFATQELSQSGAAYYGQNQLSNKLILFNRKTLKSPMGWVFGKPGSGKSFATKREILNTFFANPDDEVIIIDPACEYPFVTTMLGGEVVNISASSAAHLNPFDINENYTDAGVNPVIFKAEFILSLCSLLIGGAYGLTPVEKSIIDRCTGIIYSGVDTAGGPEAMPTLIDFYKVLEKQPDSEARNIAKALEVYVKGSLSSFAHHTNVKTNSRIVCYTTKELGTQLKTFGMMTVLDQVWNRVTANQGRGKRTWLYIDEAQNFFANEYTVDYLDKCWAEGRKMLLICTGITQNVDRVLAHGQAKQMFSNSDFMLLLSQSSNDMNILANTLSLSKQQLSYVTNSKEGCGLLVAGSAVIPFKDSFPKNTELYKMMSTDPSEAEERRKTKKRKQLLKEKSSDTSPRDFSTTEFDDEKQQKGASSDLGEAPATCGDRIVMLEEEMRQVDSDEDKLLSYDVVKDMSQSQLLRYVESWSIDIPEDIPRDTLFDLLVVTGLVKV